MVVNGRCSIKTLERRISRSSGTGLREVVAASGLWIQSEIQTRRQIPIADSAEENNQDLKEPVKMEEYSSEDRVHGVV